MSNTVLTLKCDSCNQLLLNKLETWLPNDDYFKITCNNKDCSNWDIVLKEHIMMYAQGQVLKNDKTKFNNRVKRYFERSMK